MNEEEREAALSKRRSRNLPWHSPPRVKYEGYVMCIFTASCYEHKHIIGKSTERISECASTLLEISEKTEAKLSAWCVLPNHYHLLIRTPNFEQFKKEIKLFHGRSARKWNLEDSSTGRKVWCNFFDRRIKSERHFWASINYIHNNPVHHGYVKLWQEWSFSSASNYLETVGKAKATQIWREFPVLDYGKDWDIY